MPTHGTFPSATQGVSKANRDLLVDGEPWGRMSPAEGKKSTEMTEGASVKIHSKLEQVGKES